MSKCADGTYRLDDNSLGGAERTLGTLSEETESSQCFMHS